MNSNDETLTWATEADFRTVERKCNDLMFKINWQNNVQYTDATTLADAIALVKENKDGGLEGALQVRPVNSCFKSWMDFAFLLTMCYNRNHEQKYFTILRNEYLL